jgi:hypothetical protein
MLLLHFWAGRLAPNTHVGNTYFVPFAYIRPVWPLFSLNLFPLSSFVDVLLMLQSLGLVGQTLPVVMVSWASCLKLHLHEIFELCFFPEKQPPGSADSDPRTFSNINSNSTRYLNLKIIPREIILTIIIFVVKLEWINNLFLVSLRSRCTYTYWFLQ